MKHYRDNVRKFEAVYEKQWKPIGNKVNKQYQAMAGSKVHWTFALLNFDK